MASVTSELPKAYILVMGLTGAGKSTFIFRATGDESIPIGEGLESR
jgi:GTPase SAR1 family protein